MIHDNLTAIEVKSGRALLAFAAAFKAKRKLPVGGDGIPLAEFLTKQVGHWVQG